MLTATTWSTSAHRIVGVGSVGTRAYLALLMGNDDNDPLFLQVKEAVSPAHAPYSLHSPQAVPTSGQARGVGTARLQASGDVMLGPTHVDGRSILVRQMKNMKASIPVEWLTGAAFYFYAKPAALYWAGPMPGSATPPQSPATAEGPRYSTRPSLLGPKPTATRLNGTTTGW